MAEQGTERNLSEEARLRQLAAQMQEAEYRGLSEEEIQERKKQKEQRRVQNVQILEDTLGILENGSYEKDRQTVRLRLSSEQMREIQVFLPDDIGQLRTSSRTEAYKTDDSESGLPIHSEEMHTDDSGCSFGCENIDALALAWKIYQNLRNKNPESEPRILVLNLASATQPGGHTRSGASAQEEDLCRRTSLLLSLESETAKKYYEYNNARKTRMGSDAVMITPHVEVIKDSSSEALSEPFQISVMSCAAPMVRLGLEGMSQQEYEAMLYNRIQGMLLVAASQGYRHLILGAFGCGVFGNDAAIVSNLFYRAIQDLSYGGQRSSQLFDSLDFAVLCRPERDYNYREFCRNFAPR